MSAIQRDLFQTALIGGVSYVICRSLDQARPFEKAVLVTILEGFRIFVSNAIASRENDPA